MAGVDAVSDGYRRVASHRPQRGGHVSSLSSQYFILNWTRGSRCCYNDITMIIFKLALLLIHKLELKPLTNQT